jgi:hypothetical protein
MLKSSVSLFVGFVYVVICTMKLSIEDHGQQIGSYPMTRTTSPRKRSAVGFRAKQRVRAFDSTPDRVPATCSALPRPHPSPEGARQRHVGAPSKLRAPSFPRFLGHVTRPRFRSFGCQVAAAQFGLQLEPLFLPLGCAARSRMVSLFARLHARQYLVVGARYEENCTLVTRARPGI